MDDLYALDGGRAATKWRRNASRRKASIAKQRASRRAQCEREARYDERQQRKIARSSEKLRKKKRLATRRARVREIEKAEKAKWLKVRKAEGYTPGLPYKDLKGERFGLLVVVKPGGHIKSGSKLWWVQCDCGSPLKEVRGTNLQQGFLRSCGCCGRNGLRLEWHSQKYHANRTQRYRELARPVSIRLLKLQSNLKPGSKDAKVLFQARCWIMWAEMQLGIRKPKNVRRRYSGAELLKERERALKAERLVRPRRRKRRQI